MSRRALTLMIAGFLALMFAIVGAMLPVPYVVLSPGPTENTLGEVNGKPVVSISGRQTYPTEGELSLVTVAYRGGPGKRLDLVTALRGWLDPDIAVVPEESLFPRNTSAEQVKERNTQEMSSSQEQATVAALSALDPPVPVGKAVVVADLDKGSPAEGKLKPGDEITKVDGVETPTLESVPAAVRRHRPGEEVTLTVRRGDTTSDVRVPTIANDKGEAALGIRVRTDLKFPFKVDISVGDVGGPSAGLMFALAIYDKLTPGPLTGGKSIAGTGTIDPDGKVGAIGGIEQKMVGAKKAGSTIFLTPEGNCADAVRAAPPGLRLVKVRTLREAIDALNALSAGREDVPSCTK